MLPEVLSNSLASLQEGRTRYTMSVRMEFDPEGRRTDREFVRSAIRVDKRLTYEQAHAVLTDQPDVGTEVSDDVRSLLKQMLELARILRKRRFQRGALELVMPDVEVELDANGVVVGAHLTADDESHQLIEDFMLAGNEAVAEYLEERGVTFLRRGHAEPELSKLKQFAGFVESLGFVLDPPTSRFELQRVLAWSDERPERYAVHYGLLRSLKQAAYTIEPEGHFALASQTYCHFTSPIRRYPDLMVHRQLAALLAGKTPKGDPDDMAVLAEHCSRTERRAEAAERDLIKIKLLTHLEGRVGEAFHAVIIGVEDFGLFCQLVELPIEGLLHVTSLADDFYYLEQETHTLVGRRSGRRFRLGDRIEARVARVDVDRRELDLVPVDHPWEPTRPESVGDHRRGRGRARPANGAPHARRPGGGQTTRKSTPKKGKKRRGRG
jgi:ribonuclease R